MSPRTGPTPVPLTDGWVLAPLGPAGLDPAKVEALAVKLFEPRLKVHALLLERHGRLIAEYYQGGPDKSVYALLPSRRSFGPQEVQDVRSVGKSVTGLLYGLALAQGKVPPVETSVWTAFPEHAHLRTPATANLRVEDLLNMTTGLQWREGEPGFNDELRLFWKTDLVGYVLGHAQVAAPGEQFNYNGGTTALLAELIRRGTGRSLEAFAQETLFQPLGMEGWTWAHDLHGRAMPFNGLRLRPRDLLKVGRLMLDHGVWQGRQVVPEAWVARSLSGRLTTNVRDFRYGAQWWHGTARHGGKPVAWHGCMGNGGQRLYVVPALDLSIVLTAGAYDELPTAIQVNDALQKLLDSVVG